MIKVVLQTQLFKDGEENPSLSLCWQHTGQRVGAIMKQVERIKNGMAISPGYHAEHIIYVQNDDGKVATARTEPLPF